MPFPKGKGNDKGLPSQTHNSEFFPPLEKDNQNVGANSDIERKVTYFCTDYLIINNRFDILNMNLARLTNFPIFMVI